MCFFFFRLGDVAKVTPRGGEGGYDWCCTKKALGGGGGGGNVLVTT